jgi:hypothetical protein
MEPKIQSAASARTPPNGLFAELAIHRLSEIVWSHGFLSSWKSSRLGFFSALSVGCGFGVDLVTGG